MEAVNVLLKCKANIEVCSNYNTFYLVAILIENRLFSDYSFNVQHICSSTTSGYKYDALRTNYFY